MERVSDDVQYVELADCGHSMALERPDALAEVMRDFFPKGH